MYWFLFLLPKNYLSYYFGKLARIKFPGCLMTRFLRFYCRRYGVDTSEAEHELSEYQCLQDFFVRNLRSGLRPVGEGLVSPVDGRVVECGQIIEGKLIQAKGRFYQVSELLGNTQIAQRFNGGYYITIYLAPGDYHHIHSPVTGHITNAFYIPGKLWPVNDWSVKHIKNLFSENERVVSIIESKGVAVGVVKVGATNVGSITVGYDDIVSNSYPKLGKGGASMASFNYPYPKLIQSGERLATFNLGSTVVLLIERGHFLPGSLCRTGKIKFGQTLGTIDS